MSGSGIDQFTIFSRTGIVLWSLRMEALRGDPVNRLIGEVLLEDRASAKSWDYDTFTMKWALANTVDLIFVCVYQKQFKFTFIDTLIERVQRSFCDTFAATAAQAADTVRRVGGGVGASSFVDFGDAYAAIRDEVELTHFARRDVPKMRSFADTDKGKRAADAAGSSTDGAAAEDASGAGGGKKKKKKKKKSKAKKRAARREAAAADDEAAAAEEDDGEEVEGTDPPLLAEGESAVAFEERKRVARERLKARRLGGSPKRKGGRGGGGGSATARGKSKKQMSAGEMFFDPNRKITKAELAKLDRSSAGGLAAAEKAAAGAAHVMSRERSEVFDDGGAASKSSSDGFISSSMTSMFKRLTGTKPLEREDLTAALVDMKNLLVEKNVAHDIAVVICESVCESLIGQACGSFTRVKTLVEDALRSALVRILTPNRPVDVLREVSVAKAERRPYVIVFIGVNGVGKSTTLSKVCYYFQQHGMKVLIAACDTFRSGAVEQLKTHGRRLGVEIFERGYDKDASNVARLAVKHAVAEGQDVVLIDTAGRMQKNEPLMRALAQLVGRCNPDLVLFVGEALAGNDGVDQLVMFNAALEK